MSGLTIGMFLVGVCLAKIFLGLRKERIGRKPYWQIEMEIEKENAPRRQAQEDQRIEDCIREAAWDALRQWNEAVHQNNLMKLKHPGWKWGPMPIIVYDTRRTRGIYEIHDEATAKYLKVSINDLISEKFKELKENHGAKDMILPPLPATFNNKNTENELNSTTDMAPDATT